jgi:hypothetical protein
MLGGEKEQSRHRCYPSHLVHAGTTLLSRLRHMAWAFMVQATFGGCGLQQVKVKI